MKNITEKINEALSDNQIIDKIADMLGNNKGIAKNAIAVFDDCILDSINQDIKNIEISEIPDYCYDILDGCEDSCAEYLYNAFYSVYDCIGNKLGNANNRDRVIQEFSNIAAEYVKLKLNIK